MLCCVIDYELSCPGMSVGSSIECPPRKQSRVSLVLECHGYEYHPGQPFFLKKTELSWV